TDMLLARNNPRTFLNPAAVDFPYDYNRDARVNATDMLLARNNQTHFLNALRLISVPDGKHAQDRAVSDIAKPDAVGDARLHWFYEFEQIQRPAQASKTGRGTAKAVDELLQMWGQ
ncbi:MAG: hypothetical protein JXB62_07070, partial [Pirellulales bacterium]|nr:hypothetical protein [Pirellulales bacterium]